MKRSLYHIIISVFAVCALSGCDVHEFPEAPEKFPLYLHLHYETDMPKWEHNYVLRTSGQEIPSRSVQTYGGKRYIIRAYPIVGDGQTAQEHTDEYIEWKDVSEGYNHQIRLELAPGKYDIMVWSDMTERGEEQTPYYNASIFKEITLQGSHCGNTNHRDAFRGTGSVVMEDGIREREPDTLHITMQRPLAKYEFITTDLQEFVDKEVQAAIGRGEIAEEDGSRGINIEDYRVVFYYSGYMPNTYSLFSDRPIDSAMNISFDSKLTRINDTEASLGFDYVFVNGKSASVSVQVGLYDKEGKQVSLTNPIVVPLLRSKHTLMKGSFLLQEASGGLQINPDFDGDFNIHI